MSVEVMRVGPDELVEAAWRTMRRHRIRHLAVAEDGDVVGVVSDRDLGGKETALPRHRTVRDVMTTAPVTAPPDTTLRQAANLMRGRTIGSLLVVEDGKLVGVVTTTDLLNVLGRGATRPTVRTEPAPVRRAPGAAWRVEESGAPCDRTEARPSPATPFRTASCAASVIGGSVRGRIGAALDPAERDAIARKLGIKRDKFASSIERVSVRVFDANGPRRGDDQVCRINVVLSALPSVIVERRNAALPTAIDEAIRAAALAVRSRLQRRRLTPLHHRKRTPLLQVTQQPGIRVLRGSP